MALNNTVWETAFPCAAVVTKQRKPDRKILCGSIKHQSGKPVPHISLSTDTTDQKPAENKLGQMNYIFSKKYSKYKDSIYIVCEI